MFNQFGALVLLFVPVIGICLGSFLHASAWRLTHDISLLTSSACPACKTILSWLDLMPIISWLSTRGVCRYCAYPIGITYIAAELFFGIFLSCLWWEYGISYLFFSYALFGTFLFLTFFTDYFGLIIFRDIAASMLFMGWIFSYTGLLPISFFESISASFFAFTFLQSIRLVFRWIKGIEGMGSGDPEVLAAIAAWIGLLPILHVTTGAALAASCFGLLSTILYGRQVMLKLPFCSFLTAAALLYILII